MPAAITIKHQQILDKLAAAKLVEAVSDDVSLLLFWEMLGPGRKDAFGEVAEAVISQLLERWDCVLRAPEDEVSTLYKQKTKLALATVMHKYGLQDAQVTAGALAAIDELNEMVALSDDFLRKSEPIKAFLSAPPKPLSRRPTKPESLTFLRAGDVIAMQVAGRYHAAYVHEVGQNVAPVIELYDFVSAAKPMLNDVVSHRAKGGKYNDGTERAEKYQVHGLKHLPDGANQFHLLGSGVAAGPSQTHLGAPVGLYSVTHTFKLLQSVGRLFPARP